MYAAIFDFFGMTVFKLQKQITVEALFQKCYIRGNAGPVLTRVGYEPDAVPTVQVDLNMCACTASIKGRMRSEQYIHFSRIMLPNRIPI